MHHICVNHTLIKMRKCKQKGHIKNTKYKIFKKFNKKIKKQKLKVGRIL